MQLATKLDAEVFNRQNDLRQFPASFIPRLEERIPLFNGQTYSPIDGQPSAETIEGAAAAEDAIADLRLRSGSMLNKLEWSPGLALAARDHCADAGKLGLVGPLGSKGQTPATRVALYGDAGSALGENLAYGGTQSGFEITMQLLIDDGVTQRTSRRLLFDPRWNYTGIATCAHSTRTMMTSIVYSANDFRFNEYGLAKLAENPKATQMPAPPQIPMVGGFNRDVVSNIFALQNEIRVQPKNFLDELRARPGTAAVLEAVEAIENWNQTLSPLAWNNGLFLAARDHCDDLGPKQLIGPFGTNKSSPYDRISRYGHTDFWRAENRALTSDVVGDSSEAVARQIVLDMFVDSQNGGRPQRQNLLNPNLNQIGVYTCGHGDQRFTVLDYAGKIELKSRAQDKINVLLKQHHPAIRAEEPKPERCSSVPAVLGPDCETFDELNALRKQPSDFAIMLHNMLNQFPRAPKNGRRLQVLSDKEKDRLMGVKFAVESLSFNNKYKVLKALNVVKRIRSSDDNPLRFSDMLWLAAKEHAEDICKNGANGSIGSNGFTLPYDRVAKYGRAFGLEDYIVTGGTSGLDVVMKLILEGNAKNLSNGSLKKAAVASCGVNGSNVFVIYAAEASKGNGLAMETIQALKNVKTPLNAQAESAIKQFKDELLGLVRQEREARYMGDSIKLTALESAIRVTVQKIKAEERKLVQARVDAENAKKAASLSAEKVAVIDGRIKIAEGELSVAIAKHARLTKAKDILMARGGEPMTPEEEKDFASSITSFIELVDKCNTEVGQKQADLDKLINEKNNLIGVVAAPVPVAAPVVRRAPVAIAPVVRRDPAFDKLLPDTLQELPNEAPASSAPSAFDSMVPEGLGQPANDAASSPFAGKDPFASLLPDGLKALENEDSQPRARRSARKSGFPMPVELGGLDEDVSENDVTEDILEDQDDFDFNEITAGVPGADELLSGGRRLEATKDVSDVASLLFGSANLAL